MHDIALRLLYPPVPSEDGISGMLFERREQLEETRRCKKDGHQSLQKYQSKSVVSIVTIVFEMLARKCLRAGGLP